MKQQDAEIKINKTEDNEPQHIQSEKASIEKDMVQFLNKTQDQRIKDKWAQFDKMAKKENDKLEKNNKTIASGSKDL